MKQNKIEASSTEDASFYVGLDGLRTLECLCQLIGAGSRLSTAGGAFQTGDNFIDIHAFHESADALQITVAATDKLYIFDLAVFNVKDDSLGASTGGFVFEHNGFPFVFFYIVLYPTVNCKYELLPWNMVML